MRIALAAVLLLVITGLAAAPAYSVSRHPDKFTGAPLVEGYLPIPLGADAAIYYRILEASARIAALYNVSDIVVSHVSCAIIAEGMTVEAAYSVTIQAWNRQTGEYIVVTTGPGPGGSSYVPLEEPIPVEAAAGTLMPEPDGAGLRLADALGMLALAVLNATANKTVPAAGLLPSGILAQAAGVTRFLLATANISFTMSYAIVEGGGNYTQLYTPCTLYYMPQQQGTGLSGISWIPGISRVDTRSLASALLGGLGAIISPGPQRGVLIVPLINSALVGPAIRLYAPDLVGGNESIVNPPVNVTVEEIRRTIVNGTEEDALEALREAEKLAEQGAISQEELNRLRDLFKERFGYDPFQEQKAPNKETPAPSSGGPPPSVESVALDLDKLLQSLQAIQQAPSQQAPGTGQAGLPRVSVRLPGAREALQASLLFGALAVAGLAYSERKRIIFTLRALTCKPPSGLDQRETAEWAYEAALRVLELRGLPRMPWETPREYLARAAPLLGPIAGPLEELTRVYERAAYRMEKPGRGEALAPCKKLVKTIRNPRLRLGTS